LIWLIVFVLVGGVGIYWFAQWIIEARDGVIVVAWVVTVLWGLAFTILVALWVTLLYNPQESAKEKNAKKR